MVGIQEFLDDGEYIFGSNPYGTFLHNIFNNYELKLRVFVVQPTKRMPKGEICHFATAVCQNGVKMIFTTY
jgi:hypothetical protein